jgi:hypothetical protein
MADVDKLGMAKEFEDAPQAPPEQKPPQEQPKEAQRYMREIDVGGRVQRFEAESYEALVDKFVEAQTNATKKLQELSIQRKAREPERTSSDWQEIKPQPAIGQDATQIDQFRRIFQSETGITLDEFRTRENVRRRQEAENLAVQEFVRKHEDYNPTPENAEKIRRFLEHENLPLSKRNLEYAYDELREKLAARAAETPLSREAPPAPKPEPAPAVKPLQEPPPRSTPPSFIRPSLGGPGPIEGGGQEAEIARIAQSSSLPEMKARIEQYFRQLRTSAR